MKKHKIQIYVDEYTKKAIVAIAESRGCSESFATSEILKNYLKPITKGCNPSCI